jgi:ParB family transcriptional regulator, chromosome partitioning protein
MKPLAVPSIRQIDTNLIDVINPRVRNKRIFREIVENIGDIGLKRPITVARRTHAGGPRYDLVCGQGRLEAYRALGQRTIPAIVIDADSDDCLVMSLVENCARRKHQAADLLRDIGGLKDRGYKASEIARKTGLSVEYVEGIAHLLEKGEHRLIRSVESSQIPLSIAVEIAEADDAGVQRALQQAYEKNLLRGRKLLAAKRVVEQRRRRGKGHRANVHKRSGLISSATLLRAYRDDADKRRLLIRKANATRDRLVFVTEALRALLADENFVTLLRAEHLDSLPRNIADRIQPGRSV